MLYGNVFLTAESAAYKLVLYHDSGRIPAHHDGNFFSGIIYTLVSGINLHTVLIREGNGALRLHEGMLCKWSREALCYHILSGSNRGLGISTGYVSLLTKISVRMKLRRIFRLSLCNASYRLQHFVLYLYKLLRRLQNGRGLSNNQAKSVSDATSCVPFGNHNIPVLLNMSHLVVGNIFSL